MHSRQAMDAAGPMETPERFPQVLGKPHRTRFSTSVHSHHSFLTEETKNRNLVLEVSTR